MRTFTYASWGVPSTGFDTSHKFVSSHFVSPLFLATTRALLMLYSFTTIITCYAWLRHNTATTTLKDVNLNSYTLHQSSAAIGHSFSFFTYLAFWSMGFYFLVAGYHTFMYAFHGRTDLHVSFPRALQLAHSLYYSTITTFPFLVTVVFWATMNSGWPAGRFEQWINISVHGLNSVFALVEIVLPATDPQPWKHLYFLLAVLSAYLGLAYLSRETQGFYVYEWMNPVHGNASIVLHIVAYAGVMVALFVLSRYAIVARNALAKRMERSSGDEDEERGRGMFLDDKKETWSGEVNVLMPGKVRAGGVTYSVTFVRA